MIQSRRIEWMVCCASAGVLFWGCSTSDAGLKEGNDAASPGGALNTGTGGAESTGGSSGVGGDVGTGGVPGMGGTSGNGGAAGAGGVLATGGNAATSRVPTAGGATGEGGALATGGRVGPGSSRGTGGSQSTGGSQRAGGSAGTSSSAACSSTAQIGLEAGMVIPDMELQRCDGSPVNLHDLVCGNVMTMVYSYAGWCPGCRGFSGLEEGSFMTGNSLYDKYHDDGVEQVIILSATANFGEKPTAADCAELQTLHEGLVVFDATGKKTQDVLGLKVNGGTGLVDEEGLWVVPPPVDPPQDAGLVAVFTELMERFGYR